MTIDDLIGRTFDKEGDRYGDPTTTPPIDQPTARGGITLDTLQAFYDATEPGRRASVADLKAISHASASAVLRWKLEGVSKQYGFAAVTFEPLRVQMLDFAYNSGGALAVRWFQRVLRVPRTSVVDGATRAALHVSDQWLVHQALIAARLEMIDRATDGGSIDKRYEEGLEDRALSFSLLTVP